MVTGGLAETAGRRSPGPHETKDDADWVEIGGVAAADGNEEDLSVADGTGAVNGGDAVAVRSAAVGGRGHPGRVLAADETVRAMARRHAGGFAVLRMFPLIELYLLHVYVLLQLALYGR